MAGILKKKYAHPRYALEEVGSGSYLKVGRYGVTLTILFIFKWGFGREVGSYL